MKTRCIAAGAVVVMMAAGSAWAQPARAEAQAPPGAGEARDREIARLEARIAAGSADCGVYRDLARLYNERGEFDLGLTTVRLCTSAAPADPNAYVAVAEYLQSKAFVDHKLRPDDKQRLADDGIRETDLALGIDADHLTAITLKHMFLRLKANLETDPRERRALIAEAERLRSRVNELTRAQAKARDADQAIAAGLPPGSRPLRVGGPIKAPMKVKHVNPVYPEQAQQARVQGVVVCEAVIDRDGKVADAKILRSIPLLDEAALAALRQWEFEPTLLNGEPVPIIMTVTVNFSLQ